MWHAFSDGLLYIKWLACFHRFPLLVFWARFAARIARPFGTLSISGVLPSDGSLTLLGFLYTFGPLSVSGMLGFQGPLTHNGFLSLCGTLLNVGFLSSLGALLASLVFYPAVARCVHMVSFRR